MNLGQLVGHLASHRRSHHVGRRQRQVLTLIASPRSASAADIATGASITIVHACKILLALKSRGLLVRAVHDGVYLYARSVEDLKASTRVLT